MGSPVLLCYQMLSWVLVLARPGGDGVVHVVCVCGVGCALAMEMPVVR